MPPPPLRVVPSRTIMVKQLLLLCILSFVAVTRANAFVPVSPSGTSTTSTASTTSTITPTSLSRGGAAAAAAAAVRKQTVAGHRPPSPRRPPPHQTAAAATDGAASPVGTGTATIPQEVFNLIKSIVGAGVLSLPYGVAAFGNAPSALIPATLLIALMGALSAYTFGLIGRVCQSTQTESYSDAWEAVLGRSAAWLIALSCVVDCFAGNLSYSMILADTVVHLAATAGLVITRTTALCSVTAMVLLPLCFLKNLASLAPFSLVGIAGMLYTCLAMAVRYFGGAYAAPAGRFYATTALSTPVFGTLGWKGALSARSLILTCMLSNAYIAHFNAPKFLRELKNNTMARFHQVIGWSFGVSIALYCAMTAFGFLTFGAASNGLVLNNYAVQDTWASLSRIAVAISITCSYPLIFVGTRDGVCDLLRIPQEQRMSGGLFTKLTLALMAVITAMASQLTDLGLVASVGGATFGTALVFVYPVVMFLKQQQKSGKKKTIETLPAALIGVLGVAMGAIGTVLSFQGAEL